MLKDYLPLSQIHVVNTVTDWREAIQIAAEPLLQKNAITPQYIERILTLKEEIGPYFVIAPHIAMPHSRPEDGALAQALSLLVISQGVNFDSENDPVNIVLLLAAKDSNSHLEMLSQVAELFADESAVQALIQAKDKQSAADIIYRY